MRRGFTLIELLLVVAIVSLLAVTANAGFRYFQNKSSLDVDTKNIIDTLRLAQSKTLAKEENVAYGVHLENNFYVLFSGTVYSATSTSNIIHNLLPETEVYDVSLSGGGRDVVSERVTGATNYYGSLKIKLKNQPEQFKTISIDPSGKISIGSSNMPANPALVDSRHVHFFYNLNTKTAVTLRLNFPNDNYDYDIIWQNYLNVAKDEFNWEGNVAVNGQNQIFKISTHSLSDTVAQFSIHRDRRYNTKAVNIYLDGDNLINYLADGTASKGSSPFASNPEID